MTRLAAILLVTLFALPAGAAGNVYKCTNAEGRTYYSDRACPKNEGAEKLRVPRAATEAESDSADPDSDGKTLDEKIAEATDPVRKAQLELRKQECALARTQLQRYEDAPYLVEQQDDGTQRRLSEEEAVAQKQQLRDKIARECR